MRWPDERDRELLDALIVAAAVLTKAKVGPGERRVPEVFVELIAAVDESVTSASGNADDPGSTMDGVFEVGVTPDEAGAQVGLSGRQVRNLAGAGFVRHIRVGRGYRVDLEDLRRHLRERS